jgi:hypothetical protein
VVCVNILRVIVAGHRPQYSANKDCGGAPAELMRTAFEDLWHKHNVNLCLWGHHHSYQRTKKIHHKKHSATGTVHIIVGTGGISLTKHTYKNHPHYFKAVNTKHHGYGRLSVSKTELNWEFVGVKGQVKDHVTLKK